MIWREVIEVHIIDDDLAPRVRSVNACDNLDERRLAGTVLSYQAMDFTRIHRPVDSVEGNGTAETLADILELEKRNYGRIVSFINFF